MGYGYSDKRIVELHGKNEIGDSQAVKIFRGGFVPTINVEHAMIHSGKTAMTSVLVTLSGTTPGYRMFRIGSKPIHFKEAEFVCEKDGLIVELSEAPTLSAVGTLSNSKVYHNRISSVDDEVTIYSNPTVTDQGAILETFYIPGGTAPGNNFTGGSDSESWEFILKPNTDYLVKGYRPSGSGTCKVLVKYKWYQGA